MSCLSGAVLSSSELRLARPEPRSVSGTELDFVLWLCLWRFRVRVSVYGVYGENSNDDKSSPITLTLTFQAHRSSSDLAELAQKSR